MIGERLSWEGEMHELYERSSTDDMGEGDWEHDVL